MAKYNEEDFKNSLNVIMKCKEYVNEEIGDIIVNADFSREYIKLIYLGITNTYNSFRGVAKSYLILDSYYGLCVCDYCEDGTRWKNEIVTNFALCTYAYNNTQQKTIDIALALAENWVLIKNKIKAIKDDYAISKDRNSKILASFEV